ncbi:phytanoyl-CoA dioxygenase family protein [Phenylobacterium sp. SCN 70-31]|uniref:phytanoyl-CoA dioxygenase family protein n=1 Tax=Phenylobacterium sp. SCN 70-31 TaxID=1660129 RepID=UPI0025F2C46D|nr:phytanoyl-CoA dioxygenase family protein [Phenylobacterium sp. SCN 70-31]
MSEQADVRRAHDARGSAAAEPAGPGVIEPVYVHVERFAPGSVESVAYLQEHGYVVIANALSPQEAARGLDLAWDYLEELGTGIDRSDWTTWGDDRWPTSVHGGILPGHGIGHCAAQWFIRSVPAVKAAFAAIWQDDDLLVSFDGMALWRPWALNEAWRTNRGGSWLHIDQHPITRPGLQCVQGLISLLPTSPATGGNVLIPGSHRTFEKIAEAYPERLGRVPLEVDHFRFPADDPLLTGTPPIMCHLEAGDLLLWDSRTIHCSSGSLEAPAAEAALLRAVSLICMMPRRLSSPEVLEKRRKAVERVTSTTNWTDRFINADRFPQILAEPNPERFRRPDPPVLNDYQRRLVGW